MKCKICGNVQDNTVFQAQEMMFGYRDEFTYFECSRCGCLQIAEIPSDMTKYYPKDYYSLAAVPSEESKSSIRRTFKAMKVSSTILNEGIVGKIMSKISPPGEDFKLLARTQISKESRVLDVGCGSGCLLYTLKCAGFKNLLGIDPYLEEDIEYPNGLSVRARF